MMNTAELWRSWKRVNKWLRGAFFLAIAVAICVLCLRLEPERWVLGEEVGNILTTVSLAYLMSFSTTFLWRHFDRVREQRRNEGLRANVICRLAIGYNSFVKGLLDRTGGFSSSDPPDFTGFRGAEVNRLVNERWKEVLDKGMLPDPDGKVRAYHKLALDEFNEVFEDVQPYLSMFNPTFVLLLNRIKRELRGHVHVGNDDGMNTVRGRMTQFNAVSDTIDLLRRLNAQINDDWRYDFEAYPILEADEWQLAMKGERFQASPCI